MATRSFSPTRPGLKGVWFPAALAFLLLLAVPGAALLALSLFGSPNAVNGWLQEHWGLSYHLPVPRWAGLLLLLVPFLLVLLYFLKLKRQPLRVPSTYLWRKSIDDLRVNSLFQWLRDNVLLLVQLLIALLLLYAVMAFQVHGRTSTGKHYILLIDSSASMAVTDVRPSRLEAARQEALREIDAHADGDNGMVIEFNARASILQPYTADKGLLRAAVARIRQTQRPTRVDEALTLADSLANPRKSTMNQASRPEEEDPAQARTYVDVELEAIAAEVHLFSDGRFPDVPAFAAGNLHLNYHRIGQPGPDAVDNVGIVTLNARRDEPGDGSKLRVFVRVLNFRPAECTAALEVRVNGRLRDLRGLTIPGRVLEPGDPGSNIPPADKPGAREDSFTLDEVDDTTESVIHVKLADVHDQFPADDEAWLVAGVVRKARVLIVTAGNEILSDFFDLGATAKVARVTYLKPEDLRDEAKYRRPARDGAFDLVIFDRCAPESVDALPLGNTFFIGAVPPPWQRSEMKPLAHTQIRNPASTHPLMQDLTALDEIAFSEAFLFDLRDARVPPRTPRLLETDRETAVLFVLSRRSFQDLVLTFPLVNAKGQWTTTWNLKLSFPVFLRNVLYTLGNVSDAAAEENVQPGQVKALRPDVAVTGVEVTAPGNAREVLARGAQADFSYKNTEQVGVYRAAWAGGGRRFAVNLLDAGESNVQPRDEITIGSQQLEAGQSRRRTYETWKWGALAALVLLVLEWALYHRRIFF
jgi:hypothetical protein